MKQLKAYKFRIYPSDEQKIFFSKTFGCVRFVYNLILNDRIKIVKIHEKIMNLRIDLLNKWKS